MQRLIALIVLVFAFASVAGATTAHAHRYVSTPIVVLNHVDADNVSIPVMVKVQRGEVDLGSGIVMPCGQHHAIGVSGPQLSMPQLCTEIVAERVANSTLWTGERLLRPPRSA